MAKKEIASLNVDVALDTTKATAGARQLEDSMKRVERSVSRNEKAMEKHAVDVRTTERLFRSGKISQRAYELQMQKLERQGKRFQTQTQRVNREIKTQITLMGRLANAAKRLGGGVSGTARAGGAIAGGLYGAGAIVGQAKDFTREQTRLGGDAELLGMSKEQLVGLSSAIAELGGTDAAEAVDMLFDVKERIGEAAVELDSGVGKAVQAIGLDAEKLTRLGVGEQFSEIVGAIQKLGSEEEKLFRLREIFGDSAARYLTSAVSDQNKLNALAKEYSRNRLIANEAELEAVKRVTKAWDSWSSRAKSSLAYGAGSLLGLDMSGARNPMMGMFERQTRSYGVEGSTAIGTVWSRNRANSLEERRKAALARTMADMPASSPQATAPSPKKETSAFGKAIGLGMASAMKQARSLGGVAKTLGGAAANGASGIDLMGMLVAGRQSAFDLRIQDEMVRRNEAEEDSFRRRNLIDDASSAGGASFQAGSTEEAQFLREMALQARRDQMQEKFEVEAAEQRKTANDNLNAMRTDLSVLAQGQVSDLESEYGLTAP